jgi:phospholipase D1/2
MSFFDKVLDYAERLPEGIERTRDQIIGASKLLLRPDPRAHFFTLGIINPDSEHDKHHI